MVCFDGMPVEGFSITGTGVERIAGHPYRPAVSAFVSKLIRLAWESCSGPGVRNGLAACARYVGVKLPVEALPPAVERSRLLILGSSEDRTDLLEQLARRLASAHYQQDFVCKTGKEMAISHRQCRWRVDDDILEIASQHFEEGSSFWRRQCGHRVSHGRRSWNDGDIPHIDEMRCVIRIAGLNQVIEPLSIGRFKIQVLVSARLAHVAINKQYRSIGH